MKTAAFKSRRDADMAKLHAEINKLIEERLMLREESATVSLKRFFYPFIAGGTLFATMTGAMLGLVKIFLLR